MQMQSLKKIINNKYFKWINIIIMGIYFLIIMSIDIKDMGANTNWYSGNTFITFLVNPYLKISIITYIVPYSCL